MSDDYFKLAQESVHRLDEIHQRLDEIVEELKIYQPYENGRITLSLYKCSEKGCLGCPHHRWLTWRHIVSRKGDTQFISRTIDDPWRRVKSRGEFKENAGYIKKIVLEAQNLIKEKSRFKEGFSVLNRCVKKIPES